MDATRWEAPVDILYLTWKDVCQLIDHMVANLSGHFDAVVAVSQGGIVPAGILSERLGIREVYVACVSFFEDDSQLVDWPIFLQFPEQRWLQGRRLLVVDDIWERGRTVNSVRERIEMAGGEAVTAVLHYRPPATSQPASDRMPDLSYQRHIPAAGDPPLAKSAPDVFGAATQQQVVYPWQMARGRQQA